MSLAKDLLENFEADITSLKLIPAGGGCFEVSVNGEMVYSKLATGRHAEPGEVLERLRKRLSK